MEYLVTMTTHIPDGTSEEAVADVAHGELEHVLSPMRLLAAWPDGSHALGLWRSQDGAQMQAILASLPMAPWLTEETTPLVPHLSDPAVSGSRPAKAQARQ